MTAPKVVVDNLPADQLTVATIKWSKSPTPVISAFLEKAPTWALLITALVGAWQYFDQQGKEIDQREREFQERKYKERLPSYEKVCALAAQIANAPTLESAKPLMDEFFVMYFGQMAMVEDDGVRNALISFVVKLDRCRVSSFFPDPDLPSYVTLIAEACKQSLDGKKETRDKSKPTPFGFYVIVSLVVTLIILWLLLRGTEKGLPAGTAIAINEGLVRGILEIGDARGSGHRQEGVT